MTSLHLLVPNHVLSTKTDGTERKNHNRLHHSTIIKVREESYSDVLQVHSNSVESEKNMQSRGMIVIHGLTNIVGRSLTYIHLVTQAPGQEHEFRIRRRQYIIVFY